MKTTHFALALALLAPAAACSGAGTNVSTASAQQAATKAPLSVEVDGPLRTVVDAFAEVPLRPAQRTEIESLITASVERHKKVQPMGKDVMLALADQIEKGAIDETALQTKIDAAKATLDPVRAEDRKAIQRVHDLLDADQRVALVDTLDAKRAQRFGHHGDKAKHEHAGAEKLGMMGKELDLTAEQKTKIAEAMQSEAKSWREAGAGKGHEKNDHEKPLEAFKSDTFDADKLLSFEGHRGAGAEHMIRFAKIALPILTPEQRVTAAKLIRERADKH